MEEQLTNLSPVDGKCLAPASHVDSDECPSREELAELDDAADDESESVAAKAGRAPRRRTRNGRPLQTRDEQLRLVRQYHAGDRVAGERLITENLGLVAVIARKYRIPKHVLEFDDLMQEGTLGLMRALESFDPDYGFAFSTYARWWIQQHITRAISDKGTTIRTPVHVDERKRKFYKAEKAIEATTGHTPTVKEVAEATGESVAAIEKSRSDTHRIISLDAPVAGIEGSSGITGRVADTRQADAQDFDYQLGVLGPILNKANAVELRVCLAAFLETLSDPRETEVLKLRWGIMDGDPGAPPKKSKWRNVSQAASHGEIAEIMGISRHRVGVLEADAIRRLTRYLLYEATTNAVDFPIGPAWLGAAKSTEEKVSLIRAEHRVWLRQYGRQPVVGCEPIDSVGAYLAEWAAYQRETAETRGLEIPSYLRWTRGQPRKPTPAELFERTREYREKSHGTAADPTSASYTEVAVARYEAHQRALYSRSKLEPEAITAHESLPGWYWTATAQQTKALRNSSGAAQLEKVVDEYVRFVERHGEPPTSKYDRPSEKQLRQEMNKIRSRYFAGKLSPHLVARLNRLGAAPWRRLTEQSRGRPQEWPTYYTIALANAEKYGTLERSQLPEKVVQWLDRMCERYARHSLVEFHIAQCEAIPGWTWVVADGRQRQSFDVSESATQSKGTGETR